MSGVNEWNALCLHCENVYERYGHGCPPIPTTLSDDPCQVFVDMHVEMNVGHFVAFILWLKLQPFAFGWYTLICRNHPELFRNSLCKLSFL